MTSDQRIEAAARVLARYAFDAEAKGDPEFLASMRAAAMADALIALRAAVPEYFSTRPSHWLAPMEAPMMFMDAHGPSPEEQADGHAYWAEIRFACLEDLNTQEQG